MLLRDQLPLTLLRPEMYRKYPSLENIETRTMCVCVLCVCVMCVCSVCVFCVCVCVLCVFTLRTRQQTHWFSKATTCTLLTAATHRKGSASRLVIWNGSWISYIKLVHFVHFIWFGYFVIMWNTWYYDFLFCKNSLWIDPVNHWYLISKHFAPVRVESFLYIG